MLIWRAATDRETAREIDRAGPDHLDYIEGIITINLAFALGAEAEAFAEAFGGRQADDPIPLRQIAPAAPSPLRRLRPAGSHARRQQRLELRQKPKALQVLKGNLVMIHRNQPLTF